MHFLHRPNTLSLHYLVRGSVKLRLQHSNESGGVSNSHGVTYASLFMLTAGVGYQVTKHYAFELNYYYPTTKKTLIYYNFGFSSEHSTANLNFDYMIRIHFVFSWEL